MPLLKLVRSVESHHCYLSLLIKLLVPILLGLLKLLRRSQAVPRCVQELAIIMTMSSLLKCALMLVFLLLGSPAQGRPLIRQSPSAVTQLVRRFMQQVGQKWDRKKDNRDTQATAYTSQGQDPGGPGDAFTYWWTESSSTSNYNGVYYNDDGKQIHAGDMAKGGWTGAYSKNSPEKLTNGGTTAAIATNFDPEMNGQRGTQTISGTYEGARATAGSSSYWTLAKKDSLGGAAVSNIIDTYGPSSGDNVAVRKGDGPDKRRSTAFTNIAPNSAAQSGTGNGPAAISSGYEVASAARAARDKKPDPVTIGSRENGKNGVFDKTKNRRMVRRLASAAARQHGA